MDALVHQFPKGRVDLPLPLDPAQTLESAAFYDQGEVALAARIVTGMADMLMTLIDEFQAGRGQRRREPFNHFPGDGSGGSIGHWPYIGGFTG